MTLTSNPTKEELEQYRSWVRNASKSAESKGLFQKAHYFSKRETWAAMMLDSLKDVKTMQV